MGRGQMRPAASAAALTAAVLAAVALTAGSAAGHPLATRGDPFDTCRVLTAAQFRAVLPGRPKVTDDTGKPWHVANVCDYKTTEARVGGQFSSQLYGTRAAALQSWDQFVVGENATPKRQRATVVHGVGERAYLLTGGGKPTRPLNRLGRIFWLQGRYVFQVQLEANGSRKAVSAATLTLGKQAAEKLKDLVD